MENLAEIMEKSPDRRIKNKLAAISGTNAEDWFLFSRLRHGLDLSLKTLKDVEGNGEIIMQAFTCITAVNPIVTAGLKPVFCDISAKTLSIDDHCLEGCMTRQTKAIIVQQTFGSTANLTSTRRLIEKQQQEIVLIEDAAHCVGTIARDDHGQLVPDISLHSFGAEKLLSTRFGGAVWINPEMKNDKLRSLLIKHFSNLPKMSIKTRLRVSLYPPLNGLLNRIPERFSRVFRSSLSSAGIFVSPIMSIERSGHNFGRIEQLSFGVMKRIATDLSTYEAIATHRLRIATIYKQLLGSTHYEIPSAILKHELPYVRFPLICTTPEIAESLFHQLRAKGINAGKWYKPLLFPGPHDATVYGYNHKSSPVAEDISARILNLPTGPQITPQIAKDIARAINH